MDAEITTVLAERTASGALLKFVVDLKCADGQEVPLSATGYLKTPDNMIIAPLVQVPVDQDATLRLRGSDGYARPPARRSCHMMLVAALGKAEIDYLSDYRSKNVKGDVNLAVMLGVRYLFASSTVTYLDKGTPATKDGRANSAMILDTRSRGAQALVGEGPDGFLTSTTMVFHKNHRIPGNDWIHDFAPIFGVGKFLVFEIPQPAIVGSGPVQERAAKALDAARKSEEYLREGRWTEACSALRPAWELLRNNSDIGAALRAEGYTPAAAEAFDKATSQLFQFASKFMHSLDQQGNLVAGPDIRASKEEALLVFATAMGFINLVTKKAH